MSVCVAVSGLNVINERLPPLGDESTRAAAWDPVERLNK